MGFRVTGSKNVGSLIDLHGLSPLQQSSTTVLTVTHSSVAVSTKHANSSGAATTWVVSAWLVACYLIRRFPCK